VSAPDPWPAGVAVTGVGSMPGTDPAETVRLVLGELQDLPFLPELPARGPHADLTGRSTALLAELPVDLQPSGWRLVSRPSRDQRRARDLLARDLDALEEQVQGGGPPALKVACAGPWTLAATLQLSRGERVLADHGAVDDLATSLAEGLRLHLADLARRVPGASLLLQLDEPALPAVLQGGVPTASGFGRLRVPERNRARSVLQTVLDASPSGATVVHCCAADPPLELLVGTDAGALSLDATLLTPCSDDLLGTAVEAGRRLLLGVVPSTGSRPDADAAYERVLALWRRLGFPAETLPGAVGITPTCGLAGASPGYAKAALQACVEIGRRLGEAPS